jgi:hypothetical protein
MFGKLRFFFSSSVVSIAAIAAVIAACGGQKPKSDNTFVRGPRHADIELPQLEIHSDGLDRFSRCPASGGAVQGWVPKVPAWTPPAMPAPPAAAAAKTAPADGGADAGVDGSVASTNVGEDEISIQKRADDPINAPSPTERAIRDTLRPFRSCFRRGAILKDGTHEEGRVAIAVRVGGDGRVVRSESYGACELSREVIGCMLRVAGRLRLDPPAEGRSTIIIPAVFAPKGGMSRQIAGAHDDYAAAAAVAIEGARPDFHACEQAARRAVRSPHAWGNFVIDVDEKGHGARQNIDPWDGKNQELLKCASDAIARITFPPPPGGTATVRVRVVFNRGESQ